MEERETIEREIEELKRGEAAQARDRKMEEVRELLECGEYPKGLNIRAQKQLARTARRFFTSDGELWRRKADGRHQNVPRRGCHLKLVEFAHDERRRNVLSSPARGPRESGGLPACR